MRILLPPSEGKTPPAAGRSLDLVDLSFATLGPVRERVLQSVVDLCRTDPDRARNVLGLRPSLAGHIAANADLRQAPCAPAWQVYTGVLFGSLDIGSLPRTADPDALLIASAAFGLLGHTDPIPAYRLSGTVRLPGLPTARRLWGPALREVLDALAAQHLILDLRSRSYADLCLLHPPQAVTVRVMTVRNGRRVQVSHHNKSVKGLLARHLASGPAPRSISDVLDLLGAAGWAAATTSDGVLEVLHTPPAT